MGISLSQPIPLEQVTSTNIETKIAAFYLNRSLQTMYIWACKGTGPLQPVRINGRLAWPVAKIREIVRGGA